jgi:hypothetical protein
VAVRPGRAEATAEAKEFAVPAEMRQFVEKSFPYCGNHAVYESWLGGESPPT